MLQDADVEVEPPQGSKSASVTTGESNTCVVVETLFYTKKGHSKGGTKKGRPKGDTKKDGSGGGSATKDDGSEIVFAVRVASPRPVVSTQS